MEKKTAKRLAEEIRAVGFTVTEHIGGTGVVAIFKNGPGSMVMVRAGKKWWPFGTKSP
jgi:hippurate hydrolase